MNEETFKAVIELDRDLVSQGYPLFMRVQAAQMMGQAMQEYEDFDNAMQQVTKTLTSITAPKTGELHVRLKADVPRVPHSPLCECGHLRSDHDKDNPPDAAGCRAEGCTCPRGKS